MRNIGFIQIIAELESIHVIIVELMNCRIHIIIYHKLSKHFTQSHNYSIIHQPKMPVDITVIILIFSLVSAKKKRVCPRNLLHRRRLSRYPQFHRSICIYRSSLVRAWNGPSPVFHSFPEQRSQTATETSRKGKTWKRRRTEPRTR